MICHIWSLVMDIMNITIVTKDMSLHLENIF